MKSRSLSSAGDLARLAATIVVVAAFSQGCLAGGIAKGRKDFYDGRYADATAALEHAKNARSNDRVLALMEYGLAAHDSGDYKSSSVALLDAAKRIEANDIVRVGQEAGSVVANDTIKTFQPEVHESVLVHTYLMMDFMALDDWSAARVEAKRALEKLDALDDGLEKDPYTRFLAGLAFDVMGDSSDAYIEYNKTIESAPYFAPLYRDLYRIARREGRPEARQWANALSANGDDTNDVSPNNLIVLVGAGRGPYKVEINTFVPPNLNRFVVPDYVSSGSRAHHATITIGGAIIASYSLDDVDPIAALALQKRMPKIIAKELLRVAAKEAVAQGIEQQDELMGLVARLVFMASEAADTRSWELLPRFFGVALARVPPGDYEARVDFFDENNQAVGDSQTQNLTIREGRRTVCYARSIR